VSTASVAMLDPRCEDEPNRFGFVELTHDNGTFCRIGYSESAPNIIVVWFAKMFGGIPGTVRDLNTAKIELAKRYPRATIAIRSPKS
jgi:hypothetical protein